MKTTQENFIELKEKEKFKEIKRKKLETHRDKTTGFRVIPKINHSHANRNQKYMVQTRNRKPKRKNYKRIQRTLPT